MFKLPHPLTPLQKWRGGASVHLAISILSLKDFCFCLFGDGQLKRCSITVASHHLYNGSMSSNNPLCNFVQKLRQLCGLNNFKISRSSISQFYTFAKTFFI